MSFLLSERDAERDAKRIGLNLMTSRRHLDSVSVKFFSEKGSKAMSRKRLMRSLNRHLDSVSVRFFSETIERDAEQALDEEKLESTSRRHLDSISVKFFSDIPLEVNL
jgi:hypothetical protein